MEDSLAWAKCNCTPFQLRTHLPQHVLCKLVLIWFESLPLCYLEAHTEAFRLHSDGKQSPTRTDSADDFLSIRAVRASREQRRSSYEKTQTGVLPKKRRFIRLGPAVVCACR